GREALDALGVLPAVRGRVVHDGLWSYWQYEQCTHALCNAHHLRELTFVEEQLRQPWAGQLKTLLLEIKAAADRARADGLPVLPPEPQHAWTRPPHRPAASRDAPSAARPATSPSAS